MQGIRAFNWVGKISQVVAITILTSLSPAPHFNHSPITQWLCYKNGKKTSLEELKNVEVVAGWKGHDEDEFHGEWITHIHTHSHLVTWKW